MLIFMGSTLCVLFSFFFSSRDCKYAVKISYLPHQEICPLRIAFTGIYVYVYIVQITLLEKLFYKNYYIDRTNRNLQILKYKRSEKT